MKLVDAYRAHRVTEREHVKDMIKAGTPLDAKTPTGVREVELSPWVVDELRGYRAALGMSGWMPRCSRRRRAIIATATRCATRSSSARRRRVVIDRRETKATHEACHV